MRARRFLIVVPLAALAIAGCGGDDGGDETASTPAVTTTAAPSLSKEELISQGDAICAEVNAALAAVSSNTSTGSQVGQVADLYIGMVDSLQALGTPTDDAGYDEVMSAADDLAQAESDAKLADERGDSAALSTAQTEATSAAIAFQDAAGSYGFSECSQSPGASSTTSAPAPSTDTSGTTTAPAAPTTTPATPAPAPNTGGAGGTAGSTGGGSTGGGAGGGTGGTTGGSSGGIGPG